ETRGYRFRAPTSRDLSAVVSCNDATSATIRLLERCCVACPSGAAVDATALLDDVEAGLGTLDPIADIELSRAGEACGRPWTPRPRSMLHPPSQRPVRLHRRTRRTPCDFRTARSSRSYRPTSARCTKTFTARRAAIALHPRRETCGKR